jgi:lysophospholipid acyltransferase (LPLAT)-like uncharacterized protein
MKILLKKFLKSDAGIFILSLLASFYIRLVYRTTSWTLKNFHIPQSYLDQGKPFLTCFWHGRLLMLPYGWVGRKSSPKHPFFMLISTHNDGRLISKTVSWFGIKTIGGSSNRGGSEAFRKIIQHVKQGHTIGITPDGPRGPYDSVSDGTIKMAHFCKLDILPITFSTSRAKVFKSWDKFFLPLPFSKGIISWGDPLNIQQDSLEESVKKVQNALITLRDDADRYVGAPQ